MTREEAIQKIQNDLKLHHDYLSGDYRKVLRMAIEALQQPEPKKGKWIKLDMHAHLADHKCTACGQECYVPTCMGEPIYDFCPNCGADMREGEADES